MNFCFYDNEGCVLYVLNAPTKESAERQGGDFLECGEEVSDDSHYVDLISGEPVVKRKLAMELDVVSSGLTVQVVGIPKDSVVSVSGAPSVHVDDQPTEIEFDVPGTYGIRINPPPQYRDEVLEVTVG